jgi:hypothetical protein
MRKYAGWQFWLKSQKKGYKSCVESSDGQSKSAIVTAAVFYVLNCMAALFDHGFPKMLTFCPRGHHVRGEMAGKWMCVFATGN